MIKFLVGESKMLRILVIFPLLFVAIRASGEFSVLSSPESITFTGSDVLQSQYIGDVFNAAVGNSIPGDAQWTGMTIIDPFDLATGVIAVYVDGTNRISVDSSAKTYSMAGNDADDSLNVITSELGASNAAVCDVNFNEFEEGVVSYRSCFGDMDVPVFKAKSLNPALHSADKQFLQSISFINSASDNLAAMQAAANFVFFRLSLEPISKAHGEKSEAMAEATNMIAAAVSKLNASIQKSSKKNVLVVAITNKSDGGRFKRQGEPTGTGTSTDGYNLATYYNEDYPVIFNIILWFMVTFGFSLLAICYAIGTMDPGRDSIIYRMTSTRMKKDN